MDAWPFLAQAPVVLRANNVRPYGLDCTDRIEMVRQVVPYGIPAQDRKRVESTSLSTLFHRLIQHCNRLFQLCEVLAQLVSLFALGC